MTTPDPHCSTGLPAHDINTVDTVLYTQYRAAMTYSKVQARDRNFFLFIKFCDSKRDAWPVSVTSGGLETDVHVLFLVTFLEIANSVCCIKE